MNQQADPDESEAARWVYERLAGEIDCGPRQIVRDSASRTFLLSRVLAALPPPGTRTVRAATTAWNELAPGITIKLLRLDPEANNMTAYIRMAPGAVYPAHRHSQSEECLVIEGEIFIGSHCLRAGDLHVASGGTEHATVTSPRGALMLVRCQAR